MVDIEIEEYRDIFLDKININLDMICFDLDESNYLSHTHIYTIYIKTWENEATRDPHMCY